MKKLLCSLLSLALVCAFALPVWGEDPATTPTATPAPTARISRTAAAKTIRPMQNRLSKLSFLM